MQCVRERGFSVMGHQPHVRVLILFNDHTVGPRDKDSWDFSPSHSILMSHALSQFQCVCLSSCVRCILDNFLKPSSNSSVLF